MLLPVTLVLFSAPAEAGGVGLVATGGAHTEQLFFYSNADEDGNPFSNEDDYEQYELTETLPHAGGGFEFLLGDRDDKILGVTRFYYLMDTPQTDPATVTSQVPAENVVGAYREDPRHIGMGMIGLSWGIVGNPNNFMLNAVGHLGAAFVTTDHTEFLAADLGPGVSYRVGRQMQLFGDLNYQMRYRKGFTHSGNVVVGARYLFD